MWYVSILRPRKWKWNWGGLFYCLYVCRNLSSLIPVIWHFRQGDNIPFQREIQRFDCYSFIMFYTRPTHNNSMRLILKFTKSRARTLFLVCIYVCSLERYLLPSGTDCLVDKVATNITVFAFRGSMTLIWNITLSECFANSNLITFANLFGFVARKADGCKLVKYSFLFDRYEFMAVIVETSGLISPQASKFIRWIGFMTYEIREWRGLSGVIY